MILTDKISEFLTYGDCIKSEYAIRKGLNNTPNADQIQNLMHLGKFIYDPLCEYFGRKIPITSAFRSEKVNKGIGGASSSQHVMGQAIDLDLDGSNRQIFDAIRTLKLPFDQLIWEFGTADEPSWVHVSYSNRHRKKMLKAVKIHNGKNMVTKYQNYLYV